MKRLFHSTYQSDRSKARLGEIHTSHGIIKTPAFVPVGTKGTIKTLLPSLIPQIGIQVAFVNTYHLVTHPGVDVIEKAGGIHAFTNFNIPLMSDSGGFQVFSLAKNNNARHHVLNPPHPEGAQAIGLKMMSSHDNNGQRKADIRGDEQPLVVKISDDGVKFRSAYDGQLIEFTPETSMEFQRKIGADLHMAFDECTYYPATHTYAEKAMKRTHEWLRRCIQNVKCQKSNIKNKNQNLKVKLNNQPFNSVQGEQPTTNDYRPTTIDQQHFEFAQCKPTTNDQYLYGIIQGGTYEDLRKKSAEFVVSQDVDGVAIGGVSVGETKAEMRDQVAWVADYLPKDKPVHLLGVGQIDDIIDLVKHGIDTFDCVEPTRLARMGTIYQCQMSNDKSTNQFLKINNKTIQIDINKTIYKADLSKLDSGCNCYVCAHFTKAYVHHLFKQREILGYNLATYHNLWVMERLMEKVRECIGNDFI